jgi:hypothetical protein
MGTSPISMAIFNRTGVKKSTGAAMFRPCDQHRLGPDNHLIRSTWEDEEGGRTETELVASKSSWFAGKKHASSIHEDFKHVFLRVLKNYKLSSHIWSCAGSEELTTKCSMVSVYGFGMVRRTGVAHSPGLTAPTNLAIVSPLKEMPFCIPFDNQTWLAGKSLFEMEVLIWKSSN